MQAGKSQKLHNFLFAHATPIAARVQQYVTHITIPDQSHMHTFAQDRWPNLQSFQDPSAVAELSQGGWQNSMLKPTFAKLDPAAIVAFWRNTWPWRMLTDLDAH